MRGTERDVPLVRCFRCLKQVGPQCPMVRYPGRVIGGVEGWGIWGP